MSQDWNAEQYAENARFVSDLGRQVVDWLTVRPGDRILDLGCGDGALTKELTDLGANVVGVDRSPDMIRAALARGIDARLIGGEDLNFHEEFDAVFTNAALHWMKRDPDLVISGVLRALKPGGRFVGEFGGHGNVAAISVALRAAIAKRGVECADFNPWFYPTVDEYREKLERGGFQVDRAVLIPRPTLLPTGMEGWLQTFANPFFALCQPEDIPGILKDAVDYLRPSLRDQKGVWTADYVRLRFSASKP